MVKNCMEMRIRGLSRHWNHTKLSQSVVKTEALSDFVEKGGLDG